jgi:hypothetical protein
MLFNNLPITNIQRAIDLLPFRHKFFMGHTLFVKKMCAARLSSCSFANETFGPL